MKTVPAYNTLSGQSLALTLMVYSNEIVLKLIIGTGQYQMGYVRIIRITIDSSNDVQYYRYINYHDIIVNSW